MKLGLVGGLGVLLATGPADAESAPYPEAIVDQPLDLLPGMTKLVVDQQFSSRTDKTFGDRTPDLVLLHAFGPIELAVDFGKFAELHVSLATHTFPETIEVFGLTGAPQQDDSLHVAQGALVGHRFHLQPGRLSVVAAVGLNLSENRSRDTADMLSWSQALFGFANARVEVQVVRQLALVAGASASVPLSQSGGPDFSSSLSAGGGAIVILGTWEIFANAGVSDVTDERLPNLSFGFSKRWGR